MNNSQPILYIGDNGMCLCAKHCGSSIRNTGKDISGQPAQQITKEQAKKHGLSCEACE